MLVKSGVVEAMSARQGSKLVICEFVVPDLLKRTRMELGFLQAGPLNRATSGWLVELTAALPPTSREVNW